jgi:hypothetical protein
MGRPAPLSVEEQRQKSKTKADAADDAHERRQEV